MMETVLVLPFLITLMIGILEFGTAWRDSIAVSTALRQSARTGASQGSSGWSDYYVLQALNAGLSDIPSNAVRRIVVFNATTNSAPDPACLSIAAPGGQTGARACNVYDASALILSSSAFSSSATGWCALSRSTASTAPSRGMCSSRRESMLWVCTSRCDMTSRVGSSAQG